MKHLLVRLSCLFALPALAQAVPLTTPEEKAASQVISAHVVRAHVRFLSHDLLEGRGPGTRGDALAQAYIASQFEALGLKPAGKDGTYLQPLELVGINGHPEKLAFTSADELSPEWDLSGAEEDLRLFFLLGAHVARTLEMPRWNKGDEFERPRLEALKAVRAQEAREAK